MVEWEDIKNIGIIIGILAGLVVIINFIKPNLNIIRWPIAKSKRLIGFVRELKRLWMIRNENSHDYEKMIDFYPYDPYINAVESGSSQYLDFRYCITNHSIFDFQTRKISMKILNQHNGSDIDKVDEPTEIDLPHQQTVKNSLRRKIDSNFITKLKSLKNECKPQNIILEDVKIYLIGKEVPKSCGSFTLKIPPHEINL